jgi:Holliday junction resolvase-like predicted endonuclease
MHARQQGDVGELSAATWLASKGAPVALPVCHSPDWDLIAELDGRLVRVQVKTSNARSKIGNWLLAVCTRGGNQSWNRIIKRFDKTRCEYLFAHVGDGRRWFIPSHAVEGTTSIVLGGRKYARFEIERGDPLPAPTAVDQAA